MASVLLSWGGFKFSIATASFAQFQRSKAWRWAKQPRIGQVDQLQSVGQDNDTVTLTGDIYPGLRIGDPVPLDLVGRLAALGDQREPLLMVSGTGEVMGYWVLEKLSEVRSHLVQGGVPRKQNYSLEFKYYGSDV